MNKGVRYSLATLSLALLAGCNPAAPPAKQPTTADSAAADAVASLHVANPSSFARTENLYLPFTDLGLAASDADNLVATLDNKAIPSQLIDRSGDGQGRRCLGRCSV